MVDSGTDWTKAQETADSILLTVWDNNFGPTSEKEDLSEHP